MELFWFLPRCVLWVFVYIFSDLIHSYISLYIIIKRLETLIIMSPSRNWIKKEKKKKEVKLWKKIRKIEIQRVQIFWAAIVHSCRTCKCGLTQKNLMHSFFLLLFCVFFERCGPVCLISPRYGVPWFLVSIAFKLISI